MDEEKTRAFCIRCICLIAPLNEMCGFSLRPVHPSIPISDLLEDVAADEVECSHLSLEDAGPVLELVLFLEGLVMVGVKLGAGVEMLVSFRSFVAPFDERLVPEKTVIQQTPIRKRIAPIAFRIAVQRAKSPPGGCW